MAKVIKDERVTFSDVGGYYAIAHDFFANTWKIYSNDDAYVGNFYGAANEGNPYPTIHDKIEYNSGKGWREIQFPDGIELHNAVRYVYLQWENAKLRNVIKETLRENWEQNHWGRDLPGPDPFSPSALGSEYMPENSNEISKWPESVDYPSLGVIAIRKTENADVWSFISSDSEFIATYRINTANVSKSLKMAAEKAFIKWMGLDDADIN